MKKLLTTFALYEGEQEALYNTYTRARFARYAELHGLDFREQNSKNFEVKILHPEYNHRENLHFNRWIFFKNLLDNGELQDGDYIYNFDADIFIKEMNEFILPEQSFTYAIDSGNTHCFGFFCLKINEFSRKLINLIINREKWLKITKYPFFNEHDGQTIPRHMADQHIYYVYAGIKFHSWKSFFDIPNFGFYSYITPHTEFTLDELLKNVRVLPTEWNVTQLVEETGCNGKRNTYDIVQTTREKTIFRHFAGGQPWRVAEYSKIYPLI